MLKHLVLAGLLLITAPITAANAQGFLLGMAAGGMMFGGSKQHSGESATILYSADKKTLRKTNPLAVRLIASETCFSPGYKNDISDLPLGRLFEFLMQKREKKERKILQIARVFYPSTPQCAAIWFTYIEE